MRFKQNFPLILLSFFIFFLGNEIGVAQQSALNPLPDNVSIHQLDNGLRVLLIENPALPMVGVNVVVKVGSAYETFATSGMSHMLEHLLFNGTTTRSQKQLYDDVDRIGGYNNANTSDYYTNFMMVTPAENIKQGMEIQADMLFRSTLPEKKFEKEKGIVLEEISKTLADPDEQAERNIISVLYRGHALSLPTLGTYSTIEHMDRDQVFEFYKNNYVPNNMLMSVIGNFDRNEMLKTIEEIYGQEEPGPVYREDMTDWSTGFDNRYLKEPAPGSVFHRFYDGKMFLLQLFFPVRGKHSPVFFELLDKKLSRLADDLKEQLPQEVQKVALTSRTSPVANYIQATIRLRAFPQDAQVLTDKVRQALEHADFRYDPQSLETEANKARTFFLKNVEKPHMFGIYNAHDIAVDGFEAVLQAYGKQAFLRAAEELAAFKPQTAPVVLIQSPAKKEGAKEQNRAVRPKLIEGRDGLPALIVKQNPASHLVAIHYLFKHKAMFESQYGKDAAKILHDCFGQRLQSEQNQKTSNRFGLTVKVNDNPYFPMDDIYLHPDFGYIRVEALDDDIPGLIAYLNRQMLNFRPSESEFKKAQAKFGRMNPMMMGSGDPAKKRFKELARKELYEPAPFPEAAQELTYQRLLDFARDYFQPGNMVISVVSPASDSTVREAFAGFKGFALQKEPAPYVKTIRLHTQPVTIDEKGGGSRSYLFWGFARQIDPTDKPALKALSLILSDKIVFDIREKQGMAYHMSAGIELKGNRALFYINQGTRPQNVDKLLPQYPRFFALDVLKDVTESDLQKSVNMYLGRMMFRRLSSINQAYYLGTSYYFHDDIGYDEQFLNDLKKVRLSEVLQAAKKYMQVQNPVQIVIR